MEIEHVAIKSEPQDEDSCKIIEDEVEIKEEELADFTNEAPYKCGICGHRTITDVLLKVHMKLHLVKRQHKCNICSQTFSFVTELNSHILTHTEEKNSYHCEVCGRDCFTEEDLHKHYRVHTKEKPFKCKLCFRAFSDDSYLRIHERSHHGEDYLKEAMKKGGTFVSPSVVENVNKDSSSGQVSVLRPLAAKRRFKNDPNLPLNNEEKLMLLRFVAELGLNKKYLKLEQIKTYLKNGWTKMVAMFAECNYDRNTEKLTRTYFHLKNQAKAHIERFYKLKKPFEPSRIDYMFVKLCPIDFHIPGVDLQQILEDSKKFGVNICLEDKRAECALLSDDDAGKKNNAPLSQNSTNGVPEPILLNLLSSKKRHSEDQEGTSHKIRKTENGEVASGSSSSISTLKLKYLAEEEKRREHLYMLDLQHRQHLFEIDKKHKEEIYKKELEIKDLELELLRQKLQK
ncbi:hypothetical protein NQ315_010886 [Exocentrus adspersus]|uniref:C2H2-type domain-containing protein n=1 Tax=Exocentrus adspersus TaxID=1586481 RepID=A0AAV8VP46_9CUCU|nr:hypothetical protein NQ315_010886 [Exocentrus adspersus]